MQSIKRYVFNNNQHLESDIIKVGVDGFVVQQERDLTDGESLAVAVGDCGV